VQGFSAPAIQGRIDVGSMATAMGLFDRRRPSASGETRGKEELAQLAGRVEALEDRLRRHGTMCRYPQMQSAVGKLADRLGEQLQSLKGALADSNAWPRPPAAVAHEGENDWARLSGDLSELATLGDDMHRTAIKFESLEATTAKTLMTIAGQQSDYEAELRKIALKCDPQALD
jgi:hypothetical protein